MEEGHLHNGKTIGNGIRILRKEKLVDDERKKDDEERNWGNKETKKDSKEKNDDEERKTHEEERRKNTTRIGRRKATSTRRRMRRKKRSATAVNSCKQNMFSPAFPLYLPRVKKYLSSAEPTLKVSYLATAMLPSWSTSSNIS